MSRYLALQQALFEERTRRRRSIRESLLFDELPDREFVNTFRVTPELFQCLCSEVIPLLQPMRNSRGIDPTIKILTALKFYGRGDYQGGVGRDSSIPMSQQAVSKCLNEVSEALNSPQILEKYMRFPQNRYERGIIKAGFFNKFGLPGICGAIDCTHVALHKPTFHEERYLNRKRYHSLNVQMICDHNNKIMNVDAQYGGASHDSHIWQNSAIREHFEYLSDSGENAVLLGDSGYALRAYLLTPVQGATEDSPEGRFNDIQKTARCTIERTFGILKGRWRCLLAARELYYHPEVVGKITIACSVLHNMCVAARLDPLELEQNEIEEEDELQRSAQPEYAPPVTSRASSNEALRRGREYRSQLIRNLFT